MPKVAVTRDARAVAVAVEAAVDVARVASRRRITGSRENTQRTPIAPCARRAVVLAQALAQRGEQRVVRDRAQVVDLDRLRPLLAARRADADERRAGGQRPGRERRLGAHLVAGIDRRRRPAARSSAGQLRFVDELLDRMDDAAGMDVGDALAQRLALAMPSVRRAPAPGG